MGLLKTITTQSGETGNYWCIASDEINKFGSQAYARFYCFKSKEFKDSNKNALFIDKIEINCYPDKFNQYFSAEALTNYNDIYAAWYDFVKKETDFFDDAEDV